MTSFVGIFVAVVLIDLLVLLIRKARPQKPFIVESDEHIKRLTGQRLNLTEEQIEDVLEVQIQEDRRGNYSRFGDIAIHRGMVTADEAGDKLSATGG